LLDPAIFYYNEAVQRYEQAIMPKFLLVYQLNNHIMCWGVKPHYVDCGNEWNFRSGERKYMGTKVP